ncbi:MULTISPECIES: inorganic phosphate transporter [Haloarcula]|jgi:PiT family inorganic phosphate transporter|uniref:Phosphate transporter n=1 Tax=Haloarcula marismortui ATCC 33799 TaxID=662475 RepID=M0KA91_9EURY|nr:MULTISPECIES: inorganic phosphate transporter [Haloarcula]EMA16765.1 phosphate permease [Haloarcula californiae ATCC 33799]NHX39964.1 inorganic phosphate transporter [Haloarcula sp. R1-2]
MVSILFAIGLLVAIFVGFNIGGSSTGVAFGPAVGSDTLSKEWAAVLMSAFALLGGATIGTEVIDTMGGRIVPSGQFTLIASVTILFFVGLALLVSNLFGVPASTSMTAVGAIAGLGVATGTIDWTVMGRIVSWWLVAPITAFWLSAVVGRYLYPHLEVRIAFESKGPGTTRRERVGQFLVVAIGCYMAFAAGASNVANAVAPLVGSGELGLYPGVALAGGAISIGAFTIARRTLDTVGNDLTELPILAALIVETVSATIIGLLSWAGIPASLAVSATMCVVGLGWGRATRTTSLADAAGAAVTGAAAGGGGGTVTVDALTTDRDEAAWSPPGEREVQPIGQEDPESVTSAADLFDPAATGRVVMLWILTPSISAVSSFLVFQYVLAY